MHSIKAGVCHEGNPQVQVKEVKATGQDQLIGHDKWPNRRLILSQCVCWLMCVCTDFESHAAK